MFSCCPLFIKIRPFTWSQYRAIALSLFSALLKRMGQSGSLFLLFWKEQKRDSVGQSLFRSFFFFYFFCSLQKAKNRKSQKTKEQKGERARTKDWLRKKAIVPPDPRLVLSHTGNEWLIAFSCSLWSLLSEDERRRTNPEERRRVWFQGLPRLNSGEGESSLRTPSAAWQNVWFGLVSVCKRFFQFKSELCSK